MRLEDLEEPRAHEHSSPTAWFHEPAVLAAAESQPGLVPLQLNTDSEGGEQFRRLFPVERKTAGVGTTYHCNHG